MFNEDNGNGASNLLTFVFGIAVGVAGTLIYAAANEDQFNRTIRRTKELTGQAKDRVDDYVEEAGSQVKRLTDKVQDGYDSAAAKVKGAATDVAETVETKAKQAKREINS
jgi:ABC-type transporter Mla subunit MlaD